LSDDPPDEPDPPPLDEELDEELDELEELDDELDDELDPLDEPEPESFDDEYRSLYQPPPFRWNAVAVITRSSLPPHFSQVVLGGSLIDCMYSACWWQASHS
jgi:hypothetical protein